MFSVTLCYLLFPTNSCTQLTCLKALNPLMELDIQRKKVFPSKNVFKDEVLLKLYSKC